jgi:hypothetical protein
VYNLRDDPSGFLPVPFLGSASSNVKAALLGKIAVI